MADDAIDIEDGPPNKRKGKGLLIGLVAGAFAGGGAFYAAFSGLAPTPAPVAALLGDGAEHSAPNAMAENRQDAKAEAPDATTRAAFVPVPAIIVSLGPAAAARHLQFSAQIETPPERADAVFQMQPRIIDALNTYLRAVDEEFLRDPAKMTQLRAQLLRRVRIVAGAENVRHLLITEFVLN